MKKALHIICSLAALAASLYIAKSVTSHMPTLTFRPHSSFLDTNILYTIKIWVYVLPDQVKVCGICTRTVFLGFQEITVEYYLSIIPSSEMQIFGHKSSEGWDLNLIPCFFFRNNEVTSHASCWLNFIILCHLFRRQILSMLLCLRIIIKEKKSKNAK